MKSCPVCSRTFEDTLTYCLIDGSVLSAPFDPQATLPNLEVLKTDPSPTEVVTRVGIRHNAGFQASPLTHNQFVLAPPAITEQKPLTALQIFGMWAQLVLAIIVSIVLSIAAGIILAAIIANVLGLRGNIVDAISLTTMLLTFVTLLIVTIRWWRRKRRRAGLL